MASSGKREVVHHHPDYGCLKRFRRRRLLAFLRLNNLSAAFDSLNNEMHAFFDMRFLQRLVEDGRWHEARGYMSRFRGRMRVEARTAMKLLGLLKILDDLAHGNPAGARVVELIDRRIDANPSLMDADIHCTEIIRTIFHVHSHPELRDTLDWKLVRHKTGEIVKDLIKQDPELSDLTRLPRCPMDPYCAIPFGPGLGTRRRHQVKNIGRTPASVIARRFRPKERRSRSGRNLGSPSSPKPMVWLERMIDEALLAGEKEQVEEYSPEDSHGEGIKGAPAAPSPGEKNGIEYATAGTKRVSQDDCYSGSVIDIKRPRTTGEFCQEASLRFQFPDMNTVSGPEKTYVQSCKSLETHAESPVAQVVMKTK